MICTHCSATVSTCQGYLVQISCEGTLPLVYACAPSCQGFPRAQGVLIPSTPPARPPWRDRRTDPPTTPKDSDEASRCPLLVVEETKDAAGVVFQTAVVLYYHVHEEEWVDTGCEPRDWTLWQPIDLPAYVPQQAGQDSGGA